MPARVCAPALWNIQYDIIITDLAKKYPQLCIYVDDTLLIIGAPSLPELEREVVECLKYMQEHLAWAGLELNVAKTEIMVRCQVKKCHLLPPPTFQLGNITIAPKDTIKYLGIVLDPKLNFHQHLEETAEKCRSCIALMQSLAHNTYGYEYKARRIILY